MKHISDSEIDPFTPITSWRRVGEEPVGINQIDEIIPRMLETYPTSAHIIKWVQDSVEDGTLEPNDAALLLQQIESGY